ncbi:hypothetical protein, partial [Acidithiobacillus sp.]|uniref:hypothetical protein n=1 Tax=Acidithiobacillus sp. TaxID=1872118 RepID=UPI003D06331F
MSAGDIESFATVPLQTVIPAYLYDQYNDDETLQAFIDAFNAMGQGYLDWYLNTPLAVYTSDAIVGPLLDVTAMNIYGLTRPVVSSLSIHESGFYGDDGYGFGSAYGMASVDETGTAYAATDDVFKRVMTWILWRGFDGMQMSIEWMKKRIARFLYGVNGSDVPVSDTNNISIVPSMYMQMAGYGEGLDGYGWGPAYGEGQQVSTRSIALAVTLPDIPMANTFA